MWSVGAMVLCWDVFFLFLLAHWRSLELLSQFHALVCAPKIFFAILDELKLLSWQTAKYCFWPPVFIMIFVTLWGKWKCCIVRHKSYRINGPWLRDHRQWLRDCGPWLRDHGQWLRGRGLWLRGHRQWLKDHGLWLRDHGQWLMDHASKFAVWQHFCSVVRDDVRCVWNPSVLVLCMVLLLLLHLLSLCCWKFDKD